MKPFGTLIASALLALTLLGGCATSGIDVIFPGSGSSVPVTPQTQDALPTGLAELRVAPQDVLRVDVFPRKVLESERKAEFGNELRVEFLFKGDQYRITYGDLLTIDLGGDSASVFDVPVLPNGTIKVPRLGTEMSVIGVQPARLAEVLNREYATLLLKPKIQVGIKRTGLDELTRLSGIYVVGGDGEILLPKVGSVKAVGMTADQIARALSAEASRYFYNLVEAQVSLKTFLSRMVDERVAPDGQQFFRETRRVATDGTIFLPNVGPVTVGGLTIEEVNQEVARKVGSTYANPVDVHVSLEESPAMMVFIGGEVRAPGRYPLQNSRTLLQLINSAGWVTDTADLSEIVLLHATEDNNYVRYRTNLAEVVDGQARLRQDLKLSPRDIIIVPKSGVAKLDLWVDQYVRRLMPFGMSVNYVISDVHYSNQPSPLSNNP